MKAVLPLLLAMVVTVAGAQNIFNPNDAVYTYNSGSPAGSVTNPNTPPANTMAKWVRTQKRIFWDCSKFKCYYYNGMAFRLRFPNNYDPTGATKYPLVIFYHGGGEAAAVTDNEDQLYWGAQLYEQRINAGEWNGFLLFPQQVTVGWDDSYFSRVNSIMDTIRQYNNLDPDRIITMGLSSGGYGAISHMQLYPRRIASCVSSSPQAVGTLTQSIGNSIHIPLWIANGGQDNGPDPYSTNAFISSFRGTGGNCYQTYLADEGHNTWNFQWQLISSGNSNILSPWWNRAHKAQPLVFYANDRFCTGGVNARLGVSPGYAAYEWQYDNGGGFATIGGATANEYQATQPGKYRVHFQRDAGSAWSDWTPNPVILTEKTCTTDTLYAERFEGSSTFYYAAAAYKPYTFSCQNGAMTSSTYNITQDATGKTGGLFLLHNTTANGCTYAATDEVWHAPSIVAVTPNTSYEYSFYLANRSNSNNAKILPTINGIPITGTGVQAPGNGNPSWTKFSFIWNSGNATYADLALVNQIIATSGNDFAIDEISFRIPVPVANLSPIARAGTDITMTLPTNSATLNGSASSDPDGTISTWAWTKISGPAQYSIANAGASSAQVSNLAAGVYGFRLQVTDNSGATAADTVAITVNAAAPVCGPLPSGVSTKDIGGTGFLGLGGITAGSACFTAPNAYNVKGAGDLTAKTEKFRFVYRSFSGNGTMIVKLTAQDAVSTLNKAGLMFRESLSTGANYAFLGLSSGSGAYLQSQTAFGSSVSVTNTGAGVMKAPYYLKLVRNGTSFTGSVSADSISWTTIGSKTVSMTAGTIYVGLAVCSHNNNILSEVVFTNWTILNSSGQQVTAARIATDIQTVSTATPSLVSSDLKVYPNPAAAGFTADFSVEKKQDIWISVTSGADGRICYTETLRNFSGHYSKDLGSLRLPKGSYAVTLRTETGTKTVLLIKQ